MGGKKKILHAGFDLRKKRWGSRTRFEKLMFLGAGSGKKLNWGSSFFFWDCGRKLRNLFFFTRKIPSQTIKVRVVTMKPCWPEL